jgi:predicted DCC family thiol-disulfide oxidoreductase YuxK
VTTAFRFAAERTQAAAKAWDRVFFSPADPTAVGLLRVAVGLLLLWSLGVTGLELRAYFGSDAWADPRIVQEALGRFGWSFWLVVPDWLLWPVWGLCMVVLALFTVGHWSRTTAVLAWIIAVSSARRSPVSLFGFDAILSTWAFCLAVSCASGQAVSLDRFFARYRQVRPEAARRRPDGRWSLPPGVPKPTVSANLAIRLIQLHLCVVYGMAGFSKLQGPSWWDGSAFGKLLGLSEFRPFDLSWLATFPWLGNLATHATIAFEIGYPILIWRRGWRTVLLTAAVVMHLAIALTLGLYEFALVMLAGNLAFVAGPWLRKRVTGDAQPAGRVLYDGACPRCRASMALLLAADPDRVVEPIDLTAVDVKSVHPKLTKEACLKAMHLVRSDGRILVGYDAVAALARWLPLAWPLGVVGSMPGVTWLGHRVYNHIAATRARDVPCTDEVCGLHPRAAASARGDVSTQTEHGRKSR